MRGLKGFLFSGEGVLRRFEGRETVWLPTRNPSSWVNFLNPFCRVKRESQ